jgi:lactaldehyde dehydrogenase/glycolaldehyde dehydrogenase
VRVPLGVVAAICPWNYPIAVMLRKVAPALLTGNTVVVKPSEVTPASSLEAMRLIADEVELPPGVLNLVSGGRDVGRALVASPLTNLITMTGHRDTGKAIMAAAAGNLTRVSLELGGKAPAIVCADADLGATVDALVFARFQHAGQVCTCAERILVDRAVYGEFVDRYAAAASALRVGDPMGDVDMGPVVSSVQLEKVHAAVRGAVEAGASVVTGGGRPAGDEFARGFWFAPTVLTDVEPSMEVMVEETFGPVAPIWPYERLEQALDVANRSRYGLSALVFTSDYRAAMQTADRLDCGEIYVNRTHGESLQGFHVGHRESGLGGEDGLYGVLEYTQLKTVYHHYA